MAGKFSIDKWRKKAIKMYGKARGLTEGQRAKVTASLKVSKVTRSSGNPTKPKKKVYRMAKKKGKRRRKFTLPMAVVVPVLATPFVPGRSGVGWDSPVSDAQRGDFNAALANYASGWVPIDLRRLQNGGDLQWHLPTYPLMLLAGAAIHKIAGFLGVNRMLGRSGVPIIRV